jgi:short-subunit dehydrogenase
MQSLHIGHYRSVAFEHEQPDAEAARRQRHVAGMSNNNTKGRKTIKRRIFITGASSGLGAGVALGLAAKHHVTAAAETWPQVRSLREAAEREGIGLPVVKLDLLDEIDMAHAATLAKDTDILVLNAGVQESGAMADIPIERLQRSFDINVFAHLKLVQAVLPSMLARKRGKILWLSSIAGLQPVPFLGAYSATKHAIEAIAGAMALELKPLGIDVATITPGIFRTGFNDTGAESMNQWRNSETAMVPVPDLALALKIQSDPQEMIDAMVDIIPKKHHLYRTMSPEAMVKETKIAQAAQWDAMI